MSQKIKLTQNKFTIVDNKHYQIINQYKWCLSTTKNNFYAKRRYNNKIIYLHRYLMEIEGYFIQNQQIDHINGNGLDNRLVNLRICTNTENARNTKSPKGKNNFKGVSYNKRDKNWKAYIKLNYKYIHLGNFKFEKDAAIAYNQAAQKYFGEFSNYNII